MTPIIFIGSSDFSLKCLNFLLESPKFKIKALITVPSRQKGRGQKIQNSPVKSRGLDLSLPVYTPQDLKDQNFLKEIRQLQVEFCVVCAYGKILPPEFLNVFSKPSVNIHPSLLPRWRGAAPLERALMAGDQKTGCSLQLVAQKLDTGDLIDQETFPIGEEDNLEDIYPKVEQISQKMLQKSLVSYVEGQIQPQPQGEQGVCFAPKITKEETRVDWSQPAQKIHNQVRALVLGPQAYTFFKNQRLKIYKTKVSAKNLDSLGTVVKLGENELLISCGQASLNLLEIQREGRKRQNVKEFLKGFPLQEGDRFEKGD